MSFFQEYRSANHREDGRKVRDNQRWQKPPENVIKINFDGSVSTTNRRGGIGVIARDNNGEVVGVLQASIRGITDPNVIEAYAAAKAILFGQQMGFTRIILEGDALMVINKILQTSPSLSNNGNLVDDVKGLMNPTYKTRS